MDCDDSLVERLKDTPAPVLVGLVARQSVQIEESFHRLRTLQVVRICRLSTQHTHTNS